MDKLTEIMASDYLNVPKEEMVFEAAVLWLNKCPFRKQNFEKVRSTLQFKSTAAFSLRTSVLLYEHDP